MVICESAAKHEYHEAGINRDENRFFDASSVQEKESLSLGHSFAGPAMAFPMRPSSLILPRSIVCQCEQTAKDLS